MVYDLWESYMIHVIFPDIVRYSSDILIFYCHLINIPDIFYQMINDVMWHNRSVSRLMDNTLSCLIIWSKSYGVPVTIFQGSQSAHTSNDFSTESNSTIPKIRVTNDRRISISSAVRFTRTFSTDSVDSLGRIYRIDRRSRSLMKEQEEVTSVVYFNYLPFRIFERWFLFLRKYFTEFFAEYIFEALLWQKILLAWNIFVITMNID